MLKRFCDKCGKEIEDYKVVLLDIGTRLEVASLMKPTTEKVELCNDCFEKVRAAATNDDIQAVEGGVAEAINATLREMCEGVAS